MSGDTARVVTGDCLAVLPTLAEASVDAVITDPPYGLRFMGKAWDHGVPGVPFWSAALRVAKPGAYLLAFGGTRTYHRMTCAIEDAGWQVQDCLSWLYGSGFPKHKSKLKPAWEPVVLAWKPDKRATPLNIDGCRVAAMNRPLRDARIGKPSAGVYGDGLNGSRAIGTTDAGRWPANVVLDEEAAAALDTQSGERHAGGSLNGTEPSRPAKNTYGDYTQRREWDSYGDTGGASRFLKTTKLTEDERWGVIASCAAESFDLGSDASVSVLGAVVAHTTDGWALLRSSYRAPSTSVTASEFGRISEVVTTLTRSIAQRCSLALPPESIEVRTGHVRAAAHPEPTGTTTITVSLLRSDGSAVDVTFAITPPNAGHGASGSVLDRAFYTSKAGRKERNAGLEGMPRKSPWTSFDGQYAEGRNPKTGERTGTYEREQSNHHPTVKPLDLMQWLCRLVTPKGGLILDPFCGSGTTGRAAIAEGFRFLGIELSPEYAEIARARIHDYAPLLLGEDGTA